ncbi:MAG: hypothetical protein ORN24_05715 [Burkholderiales bacterium]|nr:hypothetical protein [Burkholderiales bacterium]
MMISQSTTHEMIKFFIKSFKPNYVIHLTSRNKITNFDSRLIRDFQTDIKDPEDFIGLDIVEMVANDRKHSPEYAETLSSILSNDGTGLCAINASFKEGAFLDIPSIYILFILVETTTLGGNQIKEIKIYNYIEIAQFLSRIFNENMFRPLITLSKVFKSNIREKSLFFAFESLKYFGTFISSEMAKKTNQQQLADIVFPFHRAKSDELTPRFVNEFLRSTGYIEYDKNRKIKELSLDTLQRITSRPLIPFNSLDRNCIIRIT